MPTKLDGLERVEVTSREEWREWLKEHHSRTVGIWLVTWKKSAPAKHVGWDAIVEEALCFGWIDSLPRKLDEQRTMLYLSPRKPKSTWSRVNKERVVRLEAEERMAAAGRLSIAVAKENGSWTAIDAVEELVLPADLKRALSANSIAKGHFNAFPAGARKNILQWITSARTSATRSKRIEEAVSLAAKNQRAHQYQPKAQRANTKRSTRPSSARAT
jgi:uncharacterized protein YdeI (YjbR/CyaY-like superfamily)